MEPGARPDRSVDGARALARAAHAGQVDKQGRDYFDAHLAPIAHGTDALAAHMEFGAADRAALGPRERGRLVAAAWLHDALEDTATTSADLASAGVDPRTIAAVESVTRRADEPYEALITRACADPIGRLVKLVDNTWNLTSNPDFARVDPARARELREERYLPARQRLLDAAGLTDDSPALQRMQRTLNGERERLQG